MKKNTTKKAKEMDMINKAKNKSAIRVLYKKAGQVPEVKIIDNIQRLKRAIISQKLSIVPYENLFIICKHKKAKLNVPQNIFLPLNSICGDLIVVKIDKKQREFKELAQEDIIWYTEDLINKSVTSSNVNNISKFVSQTNEQNVISHSERGFENNSNTSFEQALLQVLINIKLVLASMLKSEDLKNE